MTIEDRPRGAPPDPRRQTLFERTQLNDLVVQINELQRRADVNPEDALLDIIENGVASVPGARYAGVTLIDKHAVVTTAAATHEHVRLLDRIQAETREGPCLASAWSHHTLRIDDLSADRRWPRYCRSAVERTPVRSVLSIRLYHDGPSLAALTFYSDEVEVFDDDSVELALIFAAHTAAALTLTQREDQFRSALASRDVIGQAKGMLMERFGIDAHAAFELLRRISQEKNVKLVDIAENLVASHRTAD